VHLARWLGGGAAFYFATTNLVPGRVGSHDGQATIEERGKERGERRQERREATRDKIVEAQQERDGVK
jgi:hypothetical protein